MRSSLLVFAVALLGCGDDVDCADVLRLDGFTLVFEAPAPATYDVDLQFTSDQPFHYQCQFVTRAVGPSQSSGCVTLAGASQLGPPLLNAGSSVELEVSQRPERVTLAIARDGQPLSTRELSLDYETEHPDGPHCGSVERARAVVAVE